MWRKHRRATLVLLFLGLCFVSLAFLPEFLSGVEDEDIWRARPAVPTIDSLNDYLRKCIGCLHKPEVVDALTRSGRRSGLLAVLDSSRPAGRRRGSDPFDHASFHPNGESVVTTGTGAASLFSVPGGARRWRIIPSSRPLVQQTVFLASSTRLASLVPNGIVYLLDDATGAETALPVTLLPDSTGLTASPDSPFLAFLSGDKEVISMDTANGKVTRYPHPGATLVHFAAGNTLLSASPREWKLWTLHSPSPRATFPSASSAPLAFSAGGDLLLSPNPTSVQLHSTATGALLHDLGATNGETHESPPIAACAAGAFAVTGTEDGYVHLWDLPSGRRLARYRAHPARVSRLVCHPTRRFLSIGRNANEAKLWTLDNFGAPHAPVLLPAKNSRWQSAVAFGADFGLRRVLFLLDWRQELFIAAITGIVLVGVLLNALRR